MRICSEDVKMKHDDHVRGDSTLEVSSILIAGRVWLFGDRSGAHLTLTESKTTHLNENELAIENTQITIPKGDAIAELAGGGDLRNHKTPKKGVWAVS